LERTTALDGPELTALRFRLAEVAGAWHSTNGTSGSGSATTITP
jgi:hypothetical protein